jgi:hypothetical protein
MSLAAKCRIRDLNETRGIMYTYRVSLQSRRSTSGYINRNKLEVVLEESHGITYMCGYRKKPLKSMIISPPQTGQSALCTASIPKALLQPLLFPDQLPG